MVLIDKLKNYCFNCTLHGLRFIADEKNNLIERVFWIVCCIFSWAMAVMIILDYWNLYISNSISLVAETDYLDWDNEFPSVSVCPSPSKKKLNEYTDTLLDLDDPFNFKRQLAELVQYNGETNLALDDCPEYSNVCPKGNFSELVKLLQPTCEETFEQCVWNGIQFDCCKYFLFLQTEVGGCYSINNINTKKAGEGENYFKMTSNRTTGPGTLTLILKAESQVYIHSTADVPYLSSPLSYILETKKHEYVVFKIQAIMNDIGVEDVPIERRQCLFPHENFLSLYSHYSIPGCLVQCRMKYVKEMCNCSCHHLSNGSGNPECDLRGYQCILGNLEMLTTEIDQWSQTEGINCSCPEECDVLIIKQVLKRTERSKQSPAISITMSQLPSARLVRKIVRDKFSAVVCIGSTLGLFIGASYLSAVEFLYFLFFRKPAKEVKKPLKMFPLTSLKRTQVRGNIGYQTQRLYNRYDNIFY